MSTRTFVTFWIFTVFINAAILGAAAYVAIHFLRKAW